MVANSMISFINGKHLTWNTILLYALYIALWIFLCAFPLSLIYHAKILTHVLFLVICNRSNDPLHGVVFELQKHILFFSKKLLSFFFF